MARLTLATPKANILDRTTMSQLSELAGSLPGKTGLRAVVITADGPNFSYDASIEEHLPGAINEVLEALRQAVAPPDAAPVER